MGKYAKKAGLAFKYYRNVFRKRPISVNMEVTKRCNARCNFCDYWKTKEEEVLEDYSPIIKKVDPMMVTITGGEPLLRRNLPEIIQKINQTVPNCYLAMVTNASLLTLEKAKQLREAGIEQISISLDFLDDRHDESRGIPGLWNRIQNLVPQLTKIGFDAVNLNWIIMEENFGQTKEAADLAKKWGAKISYTSYCSLKNHNQDHFLTPQNLTKFPELISELVEFKKKFKTIRSSDYYLSKMYSYYQQKKIPNCPAGLRWLHITPNGWLKPCSELPPVVHWKDYDPLTSFSPSSCDLCWFSCRGEAQTPLDFKRIREFL